MAFQILIWPNYHCSQTLPAYEVFSATLGVPVKLEDVLSPRNDCVSSPHGSSCRLGALIYPWG